MNKFMPVTASCTVDANDNAAITLPIKQLAYEMGYENEDYFFTVFRRTTGVTPMQYRTLTQGKK